MIFYNAASDERTAGAEVLSTSPGSLAAVSLVTHFEKRQNGRWRREGPSWTHSLLVSAPGRWAPPWVRVPSWSLLSGRPVTVLRILVGQGSSGIDKKREVSNLEKNKIKRPLWDSNQLWLG